MISAFDKTPYVAIIGDIIGSKNIRNRNEVQQKLKNSLEKINTKYQNDISANFMITLGDEFQGLLHCGTNTIKIINEIEFALYPVSVRFGIGIGEITTEINPEAPLGADGPAYYNARSMVDYLKRSSNRKKLTETNIKIKSDSQNENADMMLNTIISLLSVIKNKWKPYQIEIIALCFERGDNQTDIAKIFGVNQPAIQKQLAKANYYAYKSAIETISTVLTETEVKHDV